VGAPLLVRRPRVQLTEAGRILKSAMVRARGEG